MDGWGAIRGNPHSRPVDLEGTFEPIVDVFTKEELPRRLVILGVPGSGKSIIAQWHTVKLIEDGRDNRQVPVFLPLASWNPVVSLDDWAAAEMERMYRWLSGTIEVVNGKARSLAQELIAEGRVLMVLDGLDEIPEDNQAKALDRLTEAAKERHHFVVTCRTGEYARIVAQSAGPLKKTPVLALGTLPVSEVARYLQDAVIGEKPNR
jgi:predicted NACHT family NTPase